jgi:hypothetical protein
MTHSSAPMTHSSRSAHNALSPRRRTSSPSAAPHLSHHSSPSAAPHLSLHSSPSAAPHLSHHSSPSAAPHLSFKSSPPAAPSRKPSTPHTPHAQRPTLPGRPVRVAIRVPIRVPIRVSFRVAIRVLLRHRGNSTFRAPAGASSVGTGQRQAAEPAPQLEPLSESSQRHWSATSGGASTSARAAIRVKPAPQHASAASTRPRAAPYIPAYLSISQHVASHPPESPYLSAHGPGPKPSLRVSAPTRIRRHPPASQLQAAP